WHCGTREAQTAPAISRGEEITLLPRAVGLVPTTSATVVAMDPSTSLREVPPVRSSPGAWLELAAAGLPWLWIAGAPMTFALLVVGLVGAERIRRRSRPLPDGELTAMVRRLIDAVGIARPVAVRVCDRLAAPILLGIFRPLILLPASAVTGWS